MKKYLKQLFTEPDNATFCPVRLVAMLGALQYLGLSIANYVQHHIFDPQGYAVGFGALVGGVGVALGLKKDSPSPQATSSPSKLPLA